MRVILYPHDGRGDKARAFDLPHITDLGQLLALFRYDEIEVNRVHDGAVFMITGRTRWHRGRNKSLRVRQWDYYFSGDCVFARADGGDLDIDYDPFKHQPPSTPWSIHERFARLRDDILLNYQRNESNNDDDDDYE